MPRRTINLNEQRPLLDIVSHARRGPGQASRLTPGQIDQIARTVRRVPEVMVKVSGGGTSTKAVEAHVRYIGRRGELELETDQGERLRGRGSERPLIEDWDLEDDGVRAIYSGRPGRKAGKLVHNIVLSMPAGTPPAGLYAATRAFAREQFALKHRYAMVLHTDQAHPHVHLVVKATSELGERLNIRKATLREWRGEFARHLRAHGIPANATECAVRGQNRPHHKDGIYRAARRDSSTYVMTRTAALDDGPAASRGKDALWNTRRQIEHGWRAVGHRLAAEGHTGLAAELKRFVSEMTPPRTDVEWLTQRVRERMHLRSDRGSR